MRSSSLPSITPTTPPQFTQRTKYKTCLQFLTLGCSAISNCVDSHLMHLDVKAILKTSIGFWCCVGASHLTNGGYFFKGNKNASLSD